MKKIEILGTGCKKCNDLTELTKKTADSMQIEYEIEKVTDILKIIEYGVMATPALVVDGEVKISGKIPSADDIKKYLS
ncbi:MAG: redox-active disulfide protein 2 [Candidatus Melainabacteria bacterium GWF2_32_7]|nr:MAG: redox-active disulfide protein 2 [Candidatus Melainabacteria bacterium GWF2_32_7]